MLDQDAWSLRKTPRARFHRDRPTLHKASLRGPAAESRQLWIQSTMTTLRRSVIRTICEAYRGKLRSCRSHSSSAERRLRFAHRRTRRAPFPCERYEARTGDPSLSNRSSGNRDAVSP
jgi:hypothetical protein